MSQQSTPEKEPQIQDQPIDLSPGIKKSTTTTSTTQYNTVQYVDLEYSSDSDYDEQADSVSDPSYTRASLNIQELARSQITKNRSSSSSSDSSSYRSAFAVVLPSSASSSSSSTSSPPSAPSSSKNLVK